MPYLNGTYMECWGSGSSFNTSTYMDRITKTIDSAVKLMRQPQLIATEVWSDVSLPDLDSTSTPGMIKLAPQQKPLMRMGVAALYTKTSGYYSFYPKTFLNTYLVEHMHVYDDFFNADLGKPSASTAYKQGSATLKEWEKGTVVYNPPNAAGAQTVTFSDTRRSQATGATGTSFSVPKGDGDIFLKGNYQQLYPAPAGFPSTGLPALRPLPDTTYKDQFVGVAPAKSRVFSKTSAVKINTIIKNQQVIIQKKEPNGATKYYTTAGRQIKAQQMPKK
jgi:hypothetical protein